MYDLAAPAMRDEAGAQLVPRSKRSRKRADAPDDLFGHRKRKHDCGKIALRECVSFFFGFFFLARSDKIVIGHAVTD